ncbi:MAG: 5-formyltetrahydrofolate cyclo-ligase [Nitrososphaerota archaeon]|nr:5-formyltetrahydrofolate cyclo-ligase [Candidatus Bathyarchaeota archaeon]MCX8161879.1 5-formyltetrahydrofolate cyclo-ligase [Candidatus Bathyarchaeota archaeon]MDW8061448.1 5-formyltetrahydrofolate cyclo-ligase [Nitrososphaerota archaeon]
MGIVESKENLRRIIWNLLEERRVARYPLPCYGRIPNFEGSKQAAARLTYTEEWRRSSTILANPDYAQKPVRENALKQGKIVVMATPRLRSGFIIVDPSRIGGGESYASTIKGAFKLGFIVDKPPKPDLIVTGCVAVDREFNRLGKGGGYGDREISLARSLYGYIPVATTIHDLQLVDKIPIEEHDVKVDIVATPTKLLYRYRFR